MGTTRELADLANKLGDGITIDSSGRLIVGATSASSAITAANGNIRRVSTGTGKTNGFEVFDASSGGNHIGSFTRNLNGMNVSAFDFLSFTTGATTGIDSGSEAMRIDSSGNVGIGTSSINKTFVVHGGASDSTLQLTTTNSGTGATDGLQIAMGTGGTAVIHQRESGPLQFIMAGSEASRILTDGTQVWGATLEGTAGSVAINNTGYVHAKRGGVCGYFDRSSGDGYILEIRKSAVTVGSWGNIGQAGCFLGNSDTGLAYRPDSVALYPYNPAGLTGRDNAIDLGVSGARFDDIYATNNVIQTSDERLKTNIRDINEAETLVAKTLKGMMKAYQWTESVEEKGDDARIHFGVIAQDVKAAFEAEGLDAGRYAMFIHDHWFIDPEDGQIYKEQNEAGTREAHDRMGIRYPELFAFIIAAL